MRIQPTYLEISTLVEAEVKKLVQSLKTFSAFDVTAAIRTAVGVGVNIEHPTVRSLVHSIMAAIPGYDKLSNGYYQEYSPQQSVFTPVVPSSPTPAPVVVARPVVGTANGQVQNTKYWGVVSSDKLGRVFLSKNVLAACGLDKNAFLDVTDANSVFKVKAGFERQVRKDGRFCVYTKKRYTSYNLTVSQGELQLK